MSSCALLIELRPWETAAPGPQSWRYCRASRPERLAELPRNQVLVGDALAELRRLPSASVDCVVTSPPYHLLRDYGVAGQLGQEADVGAWVAGLRAVCAELARVLRPGGSLWLNVGDSYSRHPRFGAPAKSLLLGPERLVLALAADGWLVRNVVTWAKPNPMPSSVRDRLNTTHEFVYFLVRSKRYRFDLDAIRVPHRTAGGRGQRAAGAALGQGSGRQSTGKYADPAHPWAGRLAGRNDGLVRLQARGQRGHRLGKNPGDVWWLATAGFRGAHFATFPPGLVERPLLACCPERVCVGCGVGWQAGGKQPGGELQPGCACGTGWRPGVVLDPFFGAGTVGLVAERHGRDWVGIELNPVFAELARGRVAAERGAKLRGHRDATD